MAMFFIDFDGRPRDENGIECASLEEARNAAVSRLGAVLQHEPGFASAGHWRVDVRDGARRLKLHVIVATVEAPNPLNFASVEQSA